MILRQEYPIFSNNRAFNTIFTIFDLIITHYRHFQQVGNIYISLFSFLTSLVKSFIFATQIQINEINTKDN